MALPYGADLVAPRRDAARLAHLCFFHSDTQRFAMSVETYRVGELELRAAGSAPVLRAATEAFLTRVAAGEMPPYTTLNVTVLGALVDHGGALSATAVEEILQFFEREKQAKRHYGPALDAVWKLLSWRPGGDTKWETVCGNAPLETVHQFLDVVRCRPALSRDAMYVERALHSIYTHALFEQLYDARAVAVLQEQIQFRLLRKESAHPGRGSPISTISDDVGTV